jgi:hypothetical protein
MLLDRIVHPGSPSDLSRLPGIDLIRSTSKHAWTLQNPAGEVIDIGFDPCFAADDMFALWQAAVRRKN